MNKNTAGQTFIYIE